MVAIGSCDYCGEFCAGLGVNAVESFEFDNGWIPPSARERHGRLVYRRLQCAIRDGYDFVTSHAGPYHDPRGKALDTCPTCSDHTQMDAGYWNADLDHSRCPTCWGEVAGGLVLDRQRARASSPVAAAMSPRSTDSTAPADRARAEAGLRAYVGERMPAVRWVASPVDVVRALAAAIDAAPVSLDPDPETTVAPWSIRAHEADLAETDDDGDRAGDAETNSSAPIVSALATAIRATHAKAAGKLIDLLPVVLADAGQFSDPGPVDDPDLARLLDELRVSAGPLVVLNREIVISERPIRCSLDDLGRPHAEGGPAVVYGDGLAVFAWHGVVVPESAVGDPDRITVAAIDREENVEVRRVLVERMGLERLVRERGAALIHEDETGRLWRRGLSVGATPTWGPRRLVDEPVSFVEVINATPEADGSRRTYFLRVPPTIDTAREAVAWTFSMSAAEYRPSMET